MGWQDYAVTAIGVVVAALIVRRLICLFGDKRSGGCAGCENAGCLLRKKAKK